uniref:Uncharacterized protein n=1 Tax=Panagrolaimus sp. JU765 TaxID=591449 RepID=A0AC34RD65_9BILA
MFKSSDKPRAHIVLEMVTDRGYPMHQPTAPPECLQTPVSKPRLYPKLSTPRLMQRKKTPKRQAIPQPSSVSFENQKPHLNPQYSSIFLKNKTFEHISKVHAPGSHILFSNDDKLDPPTFPTMKKLKKCGRYILKWRGENEPSKIDYSVQGNVIPTIGGGIGVIFDDIEKFCRTFKTF